MIKTEIITIHEPAFGLYDAMKKISCQEMKIFQQGLCGKSVTLKQTVFQKIRSFSKIYGFNGAF